MALAALAASPAAHAASWADAAIHDVIAAGVLPGETEAGFDPDRTLDFGTLAMLVWGSVPGSIDRVDVPTSSAPVTIGQLDATFVAALGLDSTAHGAQAQLGRVGYAPRADAGTEIVARLLGLRTNHPAGQDRLERADTEPATRADAAWTTARVLKGVPAAYARAIVAQFARLPRTTGERHAALQRAVFQIGEPYVWGGMTEGKQVQGHGGFDCSGLVWRVLANDPKAPAGVGRRLGGRTTFEMARTTPRSGRRSRARTRPGDVLLFGSAGRRSSFSQIGHTGIDLGGGLMIHSSGQGVMIKEWDAGWHARSFAFAKSVLPR